jgi:hypothetical protein
MTREQIIAANPLERFLTGRGYELRPAGANVVTNACPVTQHKKYHRPVTIDTEKKVWHCNDCKIGGSVIDWVMAEQNISAAQAMHILGGGRNGEMMVATYDYTDANGKLLYQVCRFEPKDFRQRRPDGNGGWIWNMRGVQRVLYRLPKVIKAQTVAISEGEKDCDNVAALGFTATTNVGGARKWRTEYSEFLRGKDVIIFGDADAPGEAHIQQLIKCLSGMAKSIRRVQLPDGFHDISDFIAAQPTETAKQEVAKLIDAAPQVSDRVTSLPRNSDDEPITARLNSSLPKVQLPGDGRLLSAFATDCAKILKNCGIYQRGGVAFIVNQQRNGLDVITGAMLRTLAERHLVCFRVRCRDGVFVSLPRTMSTEDALGVLAAQQFLSRLPSVARIATARLPVMRKNGVIELLPSGYDRESLTLTLPQCDYDIVLPLLAAKKVINELLSEFPFGDDGRSKAVAIAAMVGLNCAGLFGTGIPRPVIIYLANAEGAGKTLLAKCAISPTHGLVKTDGDLKDKAETAKELLAAVIEARPYILFDNCKRHLDSPYLEAFVSSAVWSGRILGVSKMFAGENLMTVFITGNGCTVSADMRRRALFVELFMENERAEDRKFSRVLDDATLLALRPQILSALWALVRKWDAAGRPNSSRTHTAFPRWAEVIGGIVEHAGYGCPLEIAEIPSAADVDGADMRELVKLLADGEPQKFEELVVLSREKGLFERVIGSDGELKPSDKSTLGKLLKRYDRRVFAEGRRFVVDGKGHSRTFRVVSETDDVHGRHG